jgi:hypothetical protein
MEVIYPLDSAGYEKNLLHKSERGFRHLQPLQFRVFSILIVARLTVLAEEYNQNN